MNLTDMGHLIIAGAYYAVAASLVAVAYHAHRGGGLLRLVHPLVWLGAALFFFGCGSHHMDFMYHHIQDEKIDYDSIHHNAFIAMQVVGVVPFLAALRVFVKLISEDRAK